MAEYFELAMLAESPEQFSCPNSHPPVRSQASAERENLLCKDSTCTICPDAGFVWSPSYFCSPGHWKKRPSEETLADQPLHPKVWKKFPHELLLEHVFPHLPTAAICRMRALSKHWYRALSSSSPIFKNYAKLQPSFCALLGFTSRDQTCWVRAYDTHELRWHAFSIDSIPSSYACSIIVCDAGLACFVPCGQKHQLILMCNPLTGEWRHLPLQRRVFNHQLEASMDSDPMRMVQLRVDRGSGTYKVLLTDEHQTEAYDSETNEWSEFLPGKILGRVFYCTRTFPTEWEYPTEYGVHDTYAGWYFTFTHENEVLKRVPNSRGVLGPQLRVVQFANHLEEIYILLEILGERCYGRLYNLMKYEEGSWGFVLPHGLPEFHTDPVLFSELVVDKLRAREFVQLLVCKTFFLVICLDRLESNFHMKLYDIESKTWDFHLECDEAWPSVSSEDMKRAIICELRWDVSP